MSDLERGRSARHHHGGFRAVRRAQQPPSAVGGKPVIESPPGSGRSEPSRIGAPPAGLHAATSRGPARRRPRALLLRFILRRGWGLYRARSAVSTVSTRTWSPTPRWLQARVPLATPGWSASSSSRRPPRGCLLGGLTASCSMPPPTGWRRPSCPARNGRYSDLPATKTPSHSPFDWLEPVEAHHRAGQQHEREPPPRIPIPPHLQPPQATQPRQRPLDLPAIPPQPGRRLDPTPSDPRLIHAGAARPRLARLS